MGIKWDKTQQITTQHLFLIIKIIRKLNFHMINQINKERLIKIFNILKKEDSILIIFIEKKRDLKTLPLLILKIKMLNKIMAANNKLFIINLKYFMKNSKMIMNVNLIQMKLKMMMLLARKDSALNVNSHHLDITELRVLQSANRVVQLKIQGS